MIKEIALIFISTILLSGCFTDIVDEPTINTVEAKKLETFLNVNSTKYSQINDTTQFPIVAWVGVTNKNLTIENFHRMKEAGITINCSHYPNLDSVQKALDLSLEVGIKTLIDCPELSSNTVETINRFKDHPANAGYFLKDEPSAYQLPYYSDLVKLIESIDDTRFCYINLLPTYAGSEVYGAPTYYEYIQRYVNEIPLKVLSFDHYPIVGAYVRPDWYHNLEIIREISTEANIPFWAFALTTAHSSYPLPNLNHLRLQTYSNLAYGAKGIQYFTYQTPSMDDYHMGPIDRDGSRTVVYDYIKTLSEEIQIISTIFLNSKVAKVSHYGHNIPEGASSFTSTPPNIFSLKIRGGNALISELQNEEESFFMIQNNNLLSEIGIKIETDEHTFVISKKGSIIPARIIDDEFKLEPGDIALFKTQL